MNKLYQKSEIWFAIIWIIIYVVGTSVVDGASSGYEINKPLILVFHIVLTVILVHWIRNNGLLVEYGLCKANAPLSKFLYFIPLVIIASYNLWFGLTLNYGIAESIFIAASMVCVGFLEEVIFRGFLFKAMAKDSIKAAIIVSSITFGIGHIVNLINGSSDDPVATICQIFYAMAIGFVFVIIFYRGGSLWPCIITHSTVNALSVFADETGMTDQRQIMTAVILIIIPLVYAAIIMKTVPLQANTNGCYPSEEDK